MEVTSSLQTADNLRLQWTENEGNQGLEVGIGVVINQPTSSSTSSLYISLIQQYLTMFQVDNATWLAECCFAEFPKCEEGIYLHALCYYRAAKPKTARYILERYSATTITQEAGSCGEKKTLASMQYLSAQCSYELGEYSRAETALLKETRRAYKLTNTSISMDDWILQTTPCPVPNGAAGLALLGKICRKSNRKDRSVKYFKMSLQLDPFLFTSFQALCELGFNESDACEVFGGNPSNFRRSQAAHQLRIQAFSGTNASQCLHVSTMKTPLQPMDMAPATASPTIMRHNLRASAFETPGLTPIAVNGSVAQTPIQQQIKGQYNSSSLKYRGSSRPNAVIIRRARQVAARQYYPPSPDSTPAMSAVTRSLRYLRGLGTIDNTINNPSGIVARRSLFQMSLSENQGSNIAAQASNGNCSTVGADNISIRDLNIDMKTDKARIVMGKNCNEEDTVSFNNNQVQGILDMLTVAGSVYQSLCQYQCREALQNLQLLPPKHQVTPWALQQQGRALLELGDFPSAQRCLEYMHRVEPSRTQGLEMLSTVYWQLKKEMDLACLAQNALDWDLQSPEAHCVVGNCFSLQKDHETALVFFKRSLQLNPDFTYTHTLSGYEYMANEDFEKAISCFRQALRTDERHYNAWYGLGSIYHRQEKFDLAEYHFEKAVSIHPTSSVLRCNLGMSQFANGKAYQALETLSEAFRLDPRNPQARFQRATIFSALHRPEEALAELKSVRDAAPREATVHFAMGKVLKRLGRPDEAMKCFLTAMDLDPKDNQLIKSAMDKLDEPDVDEESMAAF